MGVMPKFSTRQKEEAIIKACSDYNAEGFTAVVDPGIGATDPDDIVAYQRAAGRGGTHRPRLRSIWLREKCRGGKGGRQKGGGLRR